jgi:hypothetical protein
MRQVLRLPHRTQRGAADERAKVLSVADARAGRHAGRLPVHRSRGHDARAACNGFRPSELAVSLAGDFAPVIFDLANPKLHRIVTPRDFRSP